jgi:hypothetical protein
LTIFAAPGATVEAALQWPVTGLVGTLGIRIVDTPSGSTFLVRTTAGIAENPAGSGLYEWSGTGPSTGGTWSVIWDDGSATPGHMAIEELVVTFSGLSPTTPSGIDLCTVSDVRLYLQKATGEVAQDGVIQSFITAASQEIADYTQRDLAPIASATNRFRVDGYLVDLDHDLRTVSTMTLDPDGAATVLTAAQYSLLPIGTDLQGTYGQVKLSMTLNLTSARAVLFGYNELSIAGAWGPASIDPAVAHAAIITAGLWIRREVAARGVLSPDLEVDAFDLQPRSIPGAALRALEPYRRLVVA